MLVSPRLKKTKDLLVIKVAGQIELAFKGLFWRRFKGDVVIAYEPIWAIGTGVTPTSEQLEHNKVYKRCCKRLIRGPS